MTTMRWTTTELLGNTNMPAKDPKPVKGRGKSCRSHIARSARVEIARLGHSTDMRTLMGSESEGHRIFISSEQSLTATPIPNHMFLARRFRSDRISSYYQLLDANASWNEEGQMLECSPTSVPLVQ